MKRAPCSEEDFLDAVEPDSSAELAGKADNAKNKLSRRAFVMSASVLGVASAAGVPKLARAEAVHTASETKPLMSDVTLTVNGKVEHLSLDTRTTLLDALREYMDLTGSKKGCDHGQCGACTVLVDGRRVNSCLTLAVTANGSTVTTVEGLANGEDLSAVQEAFLEHDGFQCGYCTPGQICSATALVDEMKKGQLSQVSWHTGKTQNPELTDNEIRERMSGNICRCGAYPNIVAAVRAAAGKGVSA